VGAGHARQLDPTSSTAIAPSAVVSYLVSEPQTLEVFFLKNPQIDMFPIVDEKI
jgi:hypothetical protein